MKKCKTDKQVDQMLIAMIGGSPSFCQLYGTIARGIDIECKYLRNMTNQVAATSAQVLCNNLKEAYSVPLAVFCNP